MQVSDLGHIWQFSKSLFILTIGLNLEQGTVEI